MSSDEVTPEMIAELNRVFGLDVTNHPHRVDKRILRRVQAEAPLRGSTVVNPRHYSSFAIEPIHFATVNRFDGFQFNINKYNARAYLKHETPIEDIKKILRYGEMWLKRASDDPDWWKESTMVIPGYFP